MGQGEKAMYRLTDNEREIWKRAYIIHEMFRDMSLDADGFLSLLGEIQKACNEYHNDPLMGHLGIALYDYFDTLFQRKRMQDELAVLPEEVC